ncbi:DsbA family protein [Deinococcus caeni]|uniref:DSBA-like thioredoxin domain-containing protein n=1 Tax=Deinococcus caeni TaxID=569127 RepID=A0ABP9UHW3_9DEIO
MTDPQIATQPTTQTTAPQNTTDVFIDFLCPFAWRGVELAAVLRAGGEAFTLRHFSLALFRARHEHGQPLNADTIQAAAAQAALDPERFAADLSDDTGLRATLRRDLQDAAEIGVFGTPTFVLPTGEAAYYRFENLTRDPAQARAWWDLYVTLLRDGAGVATVKRARNRPARRA